MSTPFWRSFPGSSVVKNLLAMQETRVWSLGQEDPLEKEVATHSSILAWRIPWTEEPGRLSSLELERVRQDWATKQQFLFQVPGAHWASVSFVSQEGETTRRPPGTLCFSLCVCLTPGLFGHGAELAYSRRTFPKNVLIWPDGLGRFPSWVVMWRCL